MCIKKKQRKTNLTKPYNKGLGPETVDDVLNTTDQYDVTLCE